MPRFVLFLFLLLSSGGFAQDDSRPQYLRIGKVEDAARKAEPGFALMGGGKDQDAAFQWLCRKANGGDFLILRASGGDAYNPYIQKLCPELNSVATLVIHSREAANDPLTSEAIRHAEAIFIAGGDQSNYVKYWGGTAVTRDMNDAIVRGVPIGGTSAGLAMLGEYAYSAMNDTVTSAEALANPYHERVTIERGFLKLPRLRSFITDSHFSKRDRMGRLAAFLGRIYNDGNHDIRGLGIDERSVVLLGPDGNAQVVGEGNGAYMLRVIRSAPIVVKPGAPLSLQVSVIHVPVGGDINSIAWKARNGTAYVLTAEGGKLTSSQPGGGIY
ncbi:MAG: cyanophycinase [Acidobacteria bacterium]|nr:cyanophycinase [Acidobacteriota bacterium]